MVVSGDGLLSELYNGLRSNARPSARLLPLDVIPAGSGNALAKSVSHAAKEACCPLNAALSILCCSHSIALNAATARQPGAQPVRALLSLSWGIIADIDTVSCAASGARASPSKRLFGPRGCANTLARFCSSRSTRRRASTGAQRPPPRLNWWLKPRKVSSRAALGVHLTDPSCQCGACIGHTAPFN